jgi:hypothetical protein
MLNVVAMDVTDAEGVRNAATQLKDVAIDVLINSAGIAGASGQKTGNVDYESWAHVFNVNTMGPLRVLATLRQKGTLCDLHPKIVGRRPGAGWYEFLDDFERHWPTDEDIYVDFVRDGTVGNSPARTGNAQWRRLTEQCARSAKSVFHFDLQGSVAKSTRAGIPWLRFIHQRLGCRVPQSPMKAAQATSTTPSASRQARHHPRRADLYLRFERSRSGDCPYRQLHDALR